MNIPDGSCIAHSVVATILHQQKHNMQLRSDRPCPPARPNHRTLARMRAPPQREVTCSHMITGYIIIKEKRAKPPTQNFSTLTTSRPPGEEDRYHATGRPTEEPKDVKKFYRTTGRVSSRRLFPSTTHIRVFSFPAFFLLVREHVGRTSERRHTRGTCEAVKRQGDCFTYLPVYKCSHFSPISAHSAWSLLRWTT